MLLRSLNSQRIRYPTRYLSNVKNAVRRMNCFRIGEK
ncbi:hypothetical protein T01_9119 [Trichinella spiralis]|uniref:Uncharacterized protein n=1 Tax=Trichinella spiralis TaxID=6334 RepID=A0A0V1AII5_TRISP|nr:hypothetical protein T01_6019 [Trichinella spiralis]KRY25530.1 hypothetical protein T01_9119 [Trichinella spiralis]